MSTHHSSFSRWSGALAVGIVALLSPAAIAHIPEEGALEEATVEAPASSLGQPTLPSPTEAVDQGGERPEADAAADAVDNVAQEPVEGADSAVGADSVPAAEGTSAEVHEADLDTGADADIGDAASDEATGEPATQTSDDESPAVTEAASDDPAGTEAEDNAQDDSIREIEEAERQRRLALMMEGDRLFEAGRYAEAEALYREAKGTVELEEETLERAEPVTDPTLLPLGPQGHWRRYHEGLEMGLDTRIDVPLQLLTQDYPQFIPAHLKYAERLNEKEQPEEALVVLERAVALYPDHPLLVQARIEALVTQEEWLQAAIAARQFALLNPDHPAAPELTIAADEYQRRFRRRMRSRITRRAIGNVLAGGVGFALTGNIFGPLSALQTSILLLRGETAVGERVAQQAVEELEMITDAQVLTYVNELGQELARLGGRSEFDYEFYVVAEDELNAFALPGGKIFINAGAILSTETTAELAGLVTHELSHAILSHGFQMMTGGNLVANVLRSVPYGGIATNLAVLDYSRDMERQADQLGTRILSASPYAADGMARLMATLESEGARAPFQWLSTHPDTGKRTRRLNALIEENGYNRYAYEGVEEHQRIQARVRRILIQAGVLLEIDENGDPIESETSPDVGEGPEASNPEGETGPGAESETTEPDISEPSAESDVLEPDAPEASEPSSESEMLEPGPEPGPEPEPGLGIELDPPEPRTESEAPELDSEPGTDSDVLT
ncbi:MAG: M48 family metalloprotease [Cyanobacteria bacterium P01_A01_bin.135]